MNFPPYCGAGVSGDGMMNISISMGVPASDTKDAYETLDWVDVSCEALKVDLKPCYVARGERLGSISRIELYNINGDGKYQAKIERLDTLCKFTFNGKIPSRRVLRLFLKRITFS